MSTNYITYSFLIYPTYKRSFHSKSQITHHDYVYCPITTSCSSSKSHHSSSFNSFKLNTNHSVSIRALGHSGESHGKGTPENKKTTSSSGWKKWVVGLIFSILVPSFGHKVPPLMILKSKLDSLLGQVETITEAVEELAEEAEKITEEVEKIIPEDAKQLKEAAHLVERLVKVVDKEAQLTQQLVHKVEEVENEVEELIEAEAARQKTGVVKQEKS